MFIVIEGIDGSGKTTQHEMLARAAEQAGRRVRTIAFPRHSEPFFGHMVDQYLNGEFGNATKVDARLASLLYALDRWEARSRMESWLAGGDFIILDRYATSNMAYQAAKIPDRMERDRFLAWLDTLEYDVLGIPRPDAAVFLDVPPEVGFKLTAARDGKSYVQGEGGQDQHETDMDFMRRTYEAYCDLAENLPGWRRIKAAPDGQMLPRDRVHALVLESLGEIL